MVMNGGAHPFATLSGGEVEPAAVLQAKIDSLLNQYKVITGVDLAGALPKQIREYGTAVNVSLKAVKEKLQELSDANAALAQYPLGLGVAAPQAAEELKAYAARGAELNKAAERASRKMDKLTEIRDLLQDLVNKQAPVVLAKN
jgi:DNA repair exonuclease SbcCD ATPase subunit